MNGVPEKAPPTSDTNLVPHRFVWLVQKLACRMPTGKVNRAKKKRRLSKAPKADAPAAELLSPELRASLGLKDGDDAQVCGVVTTGTKQTSGAGSGAAAKKKPVVPMSRAERRRSKSQMKKLARLEVRQPAVLAVALRQRPYAALWLFSRRRKQRRPGARKFWPPSSKWRCLLSIRRSCCQAAVSAASKP